MARFIGLSTLLGLVSSVHALRAAGVLLGSAGVLVADLQVRQGPQVQTEATCLGGWGWASNSKGQSPCLVAAYVQSPCGSSYKVTKLSPNNHYDTPTASNTTDNACSCSWSFYNLLMACTLCQANIGVDSTWTYSSWSRQCENPDKADTFFPDDRQLSNLTSIPFWAQQDPNTQWDEGRFNAGQAQQLASEGKPDFEGGASPTPTTSSSKKTSAGAIAGGVVGACIVAVIVVATTLWCLRQRRMRAKQYGNERGLLQRSLAHGRTGSDVSQVTLSSPGQHDSDKSRPQAINMLSWRSNVSSGGSSDIYPSTPPAEVMTTNTSSSRRHRTGPSYNSQWSGRMAPSQRTVSPPPVTQTDQPLENRIDQFPLDNPPSSPRPSEKSRAVASPTREMVERAIADGPSTVPAFSEAAFTTTGEGPTSPGAHRGRLNPPAYCETPEPSSASMISRMPTIPEPAHGTLRNSHVHAHRPGLASWDSNTSGGSARGSTSSLTSAGLSQAPHPHPPGNSMVIVERANQPGRGDAAHSVEM